MRACVKAVSVPIQRVAREFQRCISGSIHAEGVPYAEADPTRVTQIVFGAAHGTIIKCHLLPCGERRRIKIPEIFFGGWESIGRVLIVGILAYGALVFLVRVSGERTLASMNAFDFIVNVAIGSTLATIIVSRDISLAEGVITFIVLLGLQFIVSWSSSRSKRVTQFVKSQPRLLAYNGELLREAMRRERIDESEVLQALRSEGIDSRQDAAAVILETNGHISVLKQTERGRESSLVNVAGLHR